MKKDEHTIICPHCGKPIELNHDEEKSPKRSQMRNLVACVIISVIVCAVGFAVYMHGEQNRETQAWELAIQSNDAMTVQAYLDTYRQAPEEHRQKAAERLEQLQAQANAWNQALVSNSASELLAYAKHYPDSPYAAIALAKADSLAYVSACRGGQISDYTHYLEAYPDGLYANEARGKMQEVQVSSVSAEEKIMAEMVADRLISTISTDDKEGLISLMADTLSSFLGSSNTPRQHVTRLITKLQAPSGSSVNWMEPSDIVVTKKKAGTNSGNKTPLTNVEFTAQRDIQSSTATQSTKYKFIITLLPQGHISSIAVATLNK